jgi:hypothetical protein
MTAWQCLSIAACWLGVAGVAFLVGEPITVIIAIASAYYLSKAIVTGSVD